MSDWWPWSIVSTACFAWWIRQICQREIQTLFKDVDEFLSIAQSIINRRKSRAGRALENHVAYLLKSAGILFDPRARIDGKVEPDILIPGKLAYDDPNFPPEKLRIVGVKTTMQGSVAASS